MINLYKVGDSLSKYSISMDQLSNLVKFLIPGKESFSVIEAKTKNNGVVSLAYVSDFLDDGNRHFYLFCEVDTSEGKNRIVVDMNGVLNLIVLERISKDKLISVQDNLFDSITDRFYVMLLSESRLLERESGQVLELKVEDSALNECQSNDSENVGSFNNSVDEDLDGDVLPATDLLQHVANDYGLDVSEITEVGVGYAIPEMPSNSDVVFDDDDVL